MTDVEFPSRNEDERSIGSAIRRGLSSRCPNCGVGAIFSGYLTVRPDCRSCGEELHHHRADDAPPYFVITIVGHIVVGLAIAHELAYRPPMWLHAAIWLPLAIALSLLLLRPIKGAIIGLQWANRMHGFESVRSGGPRFSDE